MKKGLLFIFKMSLLFGFKVSAQEFPADWEFVTLRTAHFEVIVNAKQQELGKLYARKLEKAYSLVTPLFSDIPLRTTVVLADKTDLTNGYATRLPYPHIFIYPVLPGAQDSLGEHGDWILELVAHEYVHILTFDAVSGGAETLQSIFGTILSPNLLLPTWWKEGLAVHVESTVSQGGRLRSVYQDSMVRTFVKDGLLEKYDMAQINENLPDWPEGMRAYLFGSIFWSQAVAEKSPAIIDQLSQSHGGRVPYFIEAPARRYLGTTYPNFYEDALKDLHSRVDQQIAKLSRTPLREGDPWKVETQYAQGPQVSPDGERLAFIGVDATKRRSIRVLKRSHGSFIDGVEDEIFLNRREESITPPAKEAPPSGSISRLSWMPDGQGLVFDKVDFVNRYETNSDLWLFDLKKQKAEQLTRHLRAREPFVTADGKSILFVGLDGARTWLGRWDFASQKAQELWRGDWQERISFPVQMADGTILFSLRTPDGWEGIRRLRVGEKSPEVILDDFPQARFPLLTKKGLYFTSSKNGVHNLYLASSDFLSAQPVTHTLGSVFSADFDEKTGDLYASVLTSKGPQIRRWPQSAQSLPAELPVVDRLYADRYPKPVRDVPDQEVAFDTIPYSPGSYLWPQYWIPFIGLSSVNNSLVVQASTAGFDPLKKHVYAVTGQWDAGLKEASYAATYQNNVLADSLMLSGSRNVTYYVTTANPVINDFASASVAPDLFRISKYFSTLASWQWLKTTYAGTREERNGPSLLAQYANYGKNGAQISPEEGGSVFAGANNFLAGSVRPSYTQYLLTANGFWSKGLPSRHALMGRVSSAYTAEVVPGIYGVSSTNYFYSPDSPAPNYVVRGYRVGHLFGKTLATANIEYRFPLTDIHRGSGTDPFFVERVHGAVFVDGAAVDGFAYRPSTESFEAVSTNKIFGSYGAEARFETTVGYVIPLNFIIGGVVPFSREYADAGGLMTALQIGTTF